MSSFAAFGITFTFSFLAYGLFFIIFLLPKIRKMDYYKALMLLILIHCFRTVGMMTIIPSVIQEIENPLPLSFGNSVAYGDLISAVLALICVLLLFFGKMKNTFLIWIFSIVGFGDLILAVVKSIQIDATSYTIGVNWFALNFYVPLLWVTHIAIIVMLIRKKI